MLRKFSTKNTTRKHDKHDMGKPRKNDYKFTTKNITRKYKEMIEQ